MIASPFPNAGRRGMQDFLGLEPLLIDPTWNGGDYDQQPRNFPLALMAFWVFVDGAEHLWSVAPTRELSWSYLPNLAKKIAANLDANDWIYELRVNDDFNAAASLESIRAKVLVIELSGDEMVPAELGHIEQAKQILGDRINYVKIRQASGYGHSALPHTIQDYVPSIHDFISSLKT
jgi:homoserine O-acetyltransferase